MGKMMAERVPQHDAPACPPRAAVRRTSRCSLCIKLAQNHSWRMFYIPVRPQKCMPTNVGGRCPQETTSQHNQLNDNTRRVARQRHAAQRGCSIHTQIKFRANNNILLLSSTALLYDVPKMLWSWPAAALSAAGASPPCQAVLTAGSRGGR